MYKFNELVS